MSEKKPIEINLCSDCKEKFEDYIKRIQDSLDDLRVSVKYLSFDLEATQRENAQLRKMLEDKNS